MRSKRYVLFMFDDQASRWTQVSPKPSPSSPKMAPAWPNTAPSWTQVASKRAIWLYKGSARATLAFQRGMRFLCSMNSPGLWPRGVRDPKCWSFLFLSSTAMGKRILPGTFCLEPCPVNRRQAAPKVFRI